MRPSSRSRAIAIAAWLALTAGHGAAQVARQPIAAPHPAPAPAPVVSTVTQAPGAIWPQIWFQVPDGTVGIRVSRQPAGGPWTFLTPATVPLSAVPTPTGQYYYWTDETLGAPGTYRYTVTAVLADGRTATSAPFTYSPHRRAP